MKREIKDERLLEERSECEEERQTKEAEREKKADRMTER